MLAGAFGCLLPARNHDALKGIEIVEKQENFESGQERLRFGADSGTGSQAQEEMKMVSPGIVVLDPGRSQILIPEARQWKLAARG